MTKNALTAEQFQKLLIACANLPFIRPNRWATDYVVDVLQTVLDFHMQAPVVDDAITYFRDQVQAQHAITTDSQLEAVLSAYPEAGNKAASNSCGATITGRVSACASEILPPRTEYSLSRQPPKLQSSL